MLCWKWNDCKWPSLASSTRELSSRRGKLGRKKKWCALSSGLSAISVTWSFRLVWAEGTHQWACPREGLSFRGLLLPKDSTEAHKLTSNTFATMRCSNSVLWHETYNGFRPTHKTFMWHRENVLFLSFSWFTFRKNRSYSFHFVGKKNDSEIKRSALCSRERLPALHSDLQPRLGMATRSSGTALSPWCVFISSLRSLNHTNCCFQLRKELDMESVPTSPHSTAALIFGFRFYRKLILTNRSILGIFFFFTYKIAKYLSGP